MAYDSWYVVDVLVHCASVTPAQWCTVSHSPLSCTSSQFSNRPFNLPLTVLTYPTYTGVGFFYSGLLRRKNALSMIGLSVMCLAVVSFQVCISISRLGHFQLHLVDWICLNCGGGVCVEWDFRAKATRGGSVK